MATQQSKLDIIIDTRTSEQKAKDLTRVLLALEDAGIRASRANNGIGNSSSSINTTSSAVRNLTTNISQSNTASQRAMLTNNALVSSLGGVTASVLSAGTAYMGFKMILAATDEYKVMEGQIRLVTESQQQLMSIMQQLTAMSQSAGGELTASVELYAKFANASRGLSGATDEVLVRLTDTVNKFVAIGGSSGPSAAAGIFQFSQAMASGVLRGQEYNSILEQTSGLAKALSDGLGVSMGVMRTMANDGKLSSEVVMNALLRMGDTADKQFGSLARTSSQAFTIIKREIKEATNEIDRNLGASKEFIATIESLSKSIKDISLEAQTGEVNILTVAIGVLTAVALKSLLTSLNATTVAMYEKIMSTKAAMLATKEAAVAEVASARAAQLKAQHEQALAVIAANKARAVIASAEAQVVADRTVIASEVQSLRSTQTLIAAEKVLETQRLAAQINATGRAASVARMAALQQTNTLVTNELAAAEARLAATTLSTSPAVAAAHEAKTVAIAQQAATTEALNAANARVTASQTALAAATNTSAIAARGVLGVLGGPAGLVITLAAVAGGMWMATRASDAMKLSIDDLGDSAEKAAEKFKGLGRSQRQFLLIQAAEDNRANIEKLNDARNRFVSELTSAMTDADGSAAAQLSEFVRQAADSKSSLATILRQVQESNLIDPDSMFGKRRLNILIEQAAAFEQLSNATMKRVETTRALIKADQDAEAERIKREKAQEAAKKAQVKAKNPNEKGDAELQKMITEAKDRLAKDADPTAYSAALRELEAMAKNGQPVSDSLREQYLAVAKAQDALNASQLKAKETNKQLVKDEKELARELERRKDAFADLVGEASTPAEKISKEFFDRSELIREFTTKGSEQYTRLTNWAINEKDRETVEIARKHRQALAQYTDVLSTEEQVIRDKYADMRDEVNNFADFSLQQRGRALQGIEKMEEKELQAYRDKTSQLRASFDERYRLKFEFDQKLKAIDEDPNLTSDQKQMGANVVRNQHNDGIKALNQPYNDMMSELGGTYELDRLKADEEAKMTIIRDALTQQQITKEQAAEAQFRVQEEYARKERELAMTQGEELLGSMTSIMKSLAGEQSTAYKVMFAIDKGFAIAKSIMAIQTAIASAAMSAPFPANLGAMASVAAATANIVGSIQSIKLAGQAHDGIDYVPKEGTWLLDKGERVLSPRQNADLDRFMQDGGAKGGGAMMTVEVYNYGSNDIQVEQVSDDRIRIIARDVAQAEIARDGGRTAATALSNPNSDMSKGINRNFNVERRR